MVFLDAIYRFLFAAYDISKRVAIFMSQTSKNLEIINYIRSIYYHSFHFYQKIIDTHGGRNETKYSPISYKLCCLNLIFWI